MAEAAASIQRNRADVARRSVFFPVAGTLMLLLVLFAFSRTFYLRAFTDVTDMSARLGLGTLPVHLWIHGSVMTVWFTLFCIQSWLGAFRKITLHRTLGTLGVLVAAAVSISGLSTTIALIPRGAQSGMDPSVVAGIVTGNFLFQLVFISCITLAVRLRGRPFLHKRLMFFSALAVFGPATAAGNRPFGALMQQILPAGFASITFLLCVLTATLALVIRDKLVEGRVAAVAVVPGLVMAVVEIIAISSGSTAWAQGFVRLVS